MYGLHGKMKAQPGQRDALLQLMLDGTDTEKPMPGCYLYVISRADDDADGLWITEVWRDKAAHDASLSLDSVQALIAKARPLIAGFSDRSEFTPLGGLGVPNN
jgi:quinol monooxygenase YgiN